MWAIALNWEQVRPGCSRVRNVLYRHWMMVTALCLTPFDGKLLRTWLCFCTKLWRAGNFQTHFIRNMCFRLILTSLEQCRLIPWACFGCLYQFFGQDWRSLPVLCNSLVCSPHSYNLGFTVYFELCLMLQSLSDGAFRDPYSTFITHIIDFYI